MGAADPRSRDVPPALRSNPTAPSGDSSQGMSTTVATSATDRPAEVVACVIGLPGARGGPRGSRAGTATDTPRTRELIPEPIDERSPERGRDLAES